MERSLTCSDCAHYYQHYIRTHRRFVEIHDGHCGAPRQEPDAGHARL